MDKKQVQVNLRMQPESAERLKQLAESARMKIGPFVESLIAAYPADSKLLQVDSKQPDFVSAIEARLSAIETRLAAVEAVGNSKVAGYGDSGELTGKNAAGEGIAGVVPGGEDEASDSIPIMPKTFNQNKAEFKAAVVALFNDGVTNGQMILDTLTAKGFRNSKGNPYYRNDVKNAINDAGLVVVTQWAE